MRDTLRYGLGKHVTETVVELHGKDTGGRLRFKHITHALRYLAPGGRLVALCANGPRHSAPLRPIVEEHGGTCEELPADTFHAAGTSVRTVLLTVPN